MSDPSMALILAEMRGVVLTLETEHEGRPVVLRYRPAVALDGGSRFPPHRDGGTPRVLDVLAFYVGLAVGMTISGETVELSRSAMTLRTFGVLTDLAEAIRAHAGAWLAAETEAGGGIVRRATRRAGRRHHYGGVRS